MSKRRVKDWVPVALSVGAVVITSIYAVTKRSDAAQGIEVANQLASTLSEVCQKAEKGAMSADDLKAMRRQRVDMARRMEDAGKPGVVVQSLTRLARDTGLSVFEIRPTGARGAGTQKDQAYPLYSIRVGGSYRRIADFMEACEGDRVPARVCGFSVRNAAAAGQAGVAGLMAEITVEAFVPDGPAEKQGSQKQG